MHLSYNPPDRSLADIICDGLDDFEAAQGTEPAESAAHCLHRQLLLHGERHSLDLELEQRQIVLRMGPDTALLLASLLSAAFKTERR